MRVAKKSLLWSLLALPLASLLLTAFGDVPLGIIVLAMFVFEPLMLLLIARLEKVLGVRILPSDETVLPAEERSEVG